MGARDLLANAFRDAILSECGFYRYWLTRKWAEGPVLLFVMLNPSIADATVDDATIRKCVTFAHAHGFGALEVVNLFAFRASKPTDLARHGWRIGEKNDERIESAARACDAICVAWGANGSPYVDARVQQVAPLLYASGKTVQCLKITRSGYPQHPLYLRSDCRLKPWTEQAIAEAMDP